MYCRSVDVPSTCVADRSIGSRLVRDREDETGLFCGLCGIAAVAIFLHTQLSASKISLQTDRCSRLFMC